MDNQIITCPVCGELEKEDIALYSDILRKQNFGISPILPTCKVCGSEVSIHHSCAGGKIIILNGTCGSGKSTVAEEFMNRYGFYAIDGDCVMQTVKHKLQRNKVNSDEMIDEIAKEIDILSIFGKNMVLSHVIMPEDIGRYQKLFSERNLSYQFFLLKPDYDTAVSRCQTRSCHKSVTPEYWIKYFYEKLVFQNDVVILDNTNISIEQTALKIAELASISI